jgi:hypothetical protein
MRLYRSTFTFIAFLVLSISCNKKDHEVEPSENCRFVGKSSLTKQITLSGTTTYTFESHLQQDQEGKLTLITFVQNRDQDPGSAFPLKESEDEKYTFKYDADGFLVEIKRYKLILQQGNFSYFDYPFYKKGRIEINDITTFTYANKLAQSSFNKNTTVVQGDNYAAKTFETTLAKTYKYDPQGLVQTITQKSETGSESTTYFKNGMKVFADTENTKYDAKGRVIRSAYAGAEQIIEYDANDNITLVESRYQSKLQYSESRQFDNRRNPEALIPFRYKGIPDDIKILYSTDGQNNMVKKTVTYPDREPYIENTLWKYHPNGLPETSTLTVDYPGNKVTAVTTFNYENCD